MLDVIFYFILVANIIDSVRTQLVNKTLYEAPDRDCDNWILIESHFLLSFRSTYIRLFD